MRRRAERLLALSLIALAAGASLAETPSETPAEGPLVLAMFAVPWESYWSKPAQRFAERFDAPIEFAWALDSLGEACVAFRLAAGRDPAALLEALREDPRVTLAEPVQSFRTLGDGSWNDTYAGLQRSLDQLGLAAAQSIATGRDVRVAVIDTGVDLSHPDLAGQIVEARTYVDRNDKSFTTDAHGTAVAGVIAAAANNGVGIVGVAPRAELIALKACWPDPPGSRTSACDTYTLARALDRAILSEALILNLSLAGPEDALLARLLDRAEEKGKLVVAAEDETGRLPFPASHPSALAVRTAVPAGPASNAASPASGPVHAPGNDILTTGPGGTYDFFSGSSLAAAHVTGIAALVLERKPGLPPARLREILRSALRSRPDPGAGRAACTALAEAMGLEVCAGAGDGPSPGAADPL